MNGLVKVSPKSLYELIFSAKERIETYDKTPHIQIERVWSWKKFCKVDKVVYRGLPSWLFYKRSLICRFDELNKISIQAEKYGDEIWLSELCYTHLVKLSNGDKDANPVFITSY